VPDQLPDLLIQHRHDSLIPDVLGAQTVSSSHNRDLQAIAANVSYLDPKLADFGSSTRAFWVVGDQFD
jgi:hypothetical protein